MTLGARWFLVPFAVGVGLAGSAVVSAQGRPDPMTYHREIHTAIRPDPAPAAHAPAWGSWCEGQVACGGGWNDPSATPQTGPDRWTGGSSPSHSRHRLDPNLRTVDVPPADAGAGQGWWADDRTGMQPGWAGGWDVWPGPDDRARHGLRAGWHGAAPGWGGVWWYGWGGDWPSYAGGHGHRGSWQDTGGSVWGSGDRWHGEIGIQQGWGSGPRVIAQPAPRGE